MPLPLSVTDESVPFVADNATVEPLVAILFPFESFSCTIMFEVLDPLATIEVGAAVITEVVVLAICPEKSTVSVSVMATLFN